MINMGMFTRDFRFIVLFHEVGLGTTVWSESVKYLRHLNKTHMSLRIRENFHESSEIY